MKEIPKVVHDNIGLTGTTDPFTLSSKIIITPLQWPLFYDGVSPLGKRGYLFPFNKQNDNDLAPKVRRLSLHTK